MKMQRFLLTTTAFATMAFAGPPPECFVYQHDDGATGVTAVGPSVGDGIVFVNRFSVAGGNSIVKSIDVYWNRIFGDPTMVTAGVWSDPNQDGDPTDAVLVSTSAATAATGVDAFQTFDLTSDINVGPNGTTFFVGVFYENAGSGSALVGIDKDYSGPIVSWYSEFPDAPVDPNDLSNPRPLFYPGTPSDVLMIRANADIADCNGNGVPDEDDIAMGDSFDCNCNGIPDECDVLDPAMDMNGDGYIDSCTACAGDTNCDGRVDYLDILNVFQNLGSSGPLGDTNFDGVVNMLDYYIVVWNYGTICD